MNQLNTSKENGLAIVIPVLNEERTIRAIVSSALNYCNRIIVVDDGSSDATSVVIADLAITLVRHECPMGKAIALKDGFRVALKQGCAGVITMDGDGQHSTDDIPRLLAAAKRYPHHIVIGARLLGRENQPKKRRLGNNTADWFISWLCGQHILDTQSGQRYYPHLAVYLAQELPEMGFVFESEILIDAAWRYGMPVVSVPIEARYEKEFRPSHFRPWRDIAQITRMIAGRLIRRGLFTSHLWRTRLDAATIFDPERKISPQLLQAYRANLGKL